MSEARIFLKDKTPYDEVKILFPFGIPVERDYAVPIQNQDTAKPVYLWEVDKCRLTPLQKHRLAVIYAVAFNVTVEEILKSDYYISDEWVRLVEKDGYIRNHAPEEAKRIESLAKIFKRFEKAPEIRLALPMRTAFLLVCQIQLASRHPLNDGSSFNEIAGIATAIQSSIGTFSEEAEDYLEMGWNSQNDVKFEKVQSPSHDPLKSFVETFFVEYDTPNNPV